MPAILASVAGAAKAETVIDAGGVHWLIPDRPGQTVEIMVSGEEQVSGMNFWAQIGDGGPEMVELGLPPGTDGPEFTDVDLKTGTIFSGIPDAQSGFILIPQVAQYTIAISEPGGSVTASGRLATLTIDTSGFFTGTWDLSLDNVLPGYSEVPFATELLYENEVIAVGIQNGSISLARRGDCNRDGYVNADDLTILAAHWLSDDGVGWDEGDFNGDGRVDDADATMLVVNGEFTPGIAATVPEPAPSVILSICVLIYFGYLFSRTASATPY